MIHKVGAKQWDLHWLKMADEEFWTLDSMLLEGEIAEQRAVSLDILDTRKSSRRTSVRPASSRGTGHSRSSQTQKSRDAKEEGDYEEEITLALSAAAEGSEDILLDCFSADSFASLLSRVLKHLNLRPASNEDIVPEAPKKEFSGDVVPESPKDRLSEEVAIATSTEDALNAESSPSENSAKLNSELRVQAELLDELSLRFQKTQKLLKDQNTRIAEANQEIFNLKELILGSNADDNQTVSNNNLMAPVSSLHKSGSSRNSIRFSANTEGINTGELEIPSPVGSNVAPTGELFLGSEVEEGVYFQHTYTFSRCVQSNDNGRSQNAGGKEAFRSADRTGYRFAVYGRKGDQAIESISAFDQSSVSA